MQLVQVPVRDLELGMFVAELDRPWLDTPFLLQGFLLDEAAQIDALQLHCGFVLVDRDRSVGEVLERLPQAAVAEPVPHPLPPEPRVYVAPHKVVANKSVHSTAAPGADEADEDEHYQGESVLGGLVRGFRGLFAKSEKRPSSHNVTVRDNQPPVQAAPRRDPMFPGVALVQYQAIKPLQDAVPQAREALNDAGALLEQTIVDVRNAIPVNMASVQDAVQCMVGSLVDNPDALQWVARLRQNSSAAYEQSLKSAIYIIAMGRHVGLPRDELNQLGTAGMLMDIGKLQIERELLSRAGRLDEREFEKVKAHVDKGLALLEPSGGLHLSVRTAIAQHHERLDGSGYPFGLKAGEISMYGRMAGLVDTFVAMTSQRPYAKPYAAYDALDRINGWSGRLFNEQLVEKFVQAIGVYPVGSLVELSNGEVAAVLHHNPLRRLRPTVLVLAGRDKQPLKKPRARDLLTQTEAEDGTPLRIARGLPAGAYSINVRDHYLET